mmetsp:Transcript_51195/g.115079  ORF Transcript_51195/g.115079 Transcript_51195/m.115079 type:complete len:263 (-) Transcript_51195:301-1089(-)
MGHSLQGVHDGTRQVIRGVGLVRSLRLRVRLQVAAVDGGVTQCAVIRVVLDLGAQAALEALLRSRQHLLEETHVLLHRLITERRRLLHHSQGLLLLLSGRVDERKSVLDHLHCDVLDLLEPIGSVADLRWLDLQQRQRLYDGMLILLLLLGRVGVIETEQELALVLRGEVGVEHRGLHVADVQVAARLGREASHHLAHLGVWQRDLKRPRVLLHAEKVLRQTLQWWLRFQILPPALQVRHGRADRLGAERVRSQRNPHRSVC